jgi:hypothetical protein
MNAERHLIKDGTETKDFPFILGTWPFDPLAFFSHKQSLSRISVTNIIKDAQAVKVAHETIRHHLIKKFVNLTYFRRSRKIAKSGC